MSDDHYVYMHGHRLDNNIITGKNKAHGWMRVDIQAPRMQNCKAIDS